VGKTRCELAPRRITDVLGQAMVLHHPMNRHILNRDQIMGVDQATAVLVRFLQISAPTVRYFMLP